MRFDIYQLSVEKRARVTEKERKGSVNLAHGLTAVTHDDTREKFFLL